MERLVKKVVAGPHKGEIGHLVSIPWLGNLWNMRMTLNCQGDTKLSRKWIKVWRWQTEDVLDG